MLAMPLTYMAGKYGHTEAIIAVWVAIVLVNLIDYLKS